MGQFPCIHKLIKRNIFVECINSRTSLKTMPRKQARGEDTVCRLTGLSSTEVLSAPVLISLVTSKIFSSSHSVMDMKNLLATTTTNLVELLPHKAMTLGVFIHLLFQGFQDERDITILSCICSYAVGWQADSYFSEKKKILFL